MAEAFDGNQLLFDLGDLAEIRRRLAPGQACIPAKSGTGPEGETCGSCAHCIRTGNCPENRVYLKCGLMRPNWTHGPGTDIRARWHACSHWQAKTPEVEA